MLTYFLVDDGKAMPRWCQLVPNKADEGLDWIDAKMRRWPKDAGRPLAVVEGDTIECTIDGIPRLISDLVRDYALDRLLDPWSNQGWLSPEGRFFGCAYYAHDDLAHALLRRRTGDLEHAGFIRVHDDSYRTSATSRVRVTERQRDTLERLGFDLEEFRRNPYEADRTAMPPSFAFKPADLRIALPVPEPDLAVTAGNLSPLVERLRASEAFGFLFEAGEPELVTDLGGGNWDWLLYFDGPGFNLGTGERVRDLVEAPGMYLHATASDQVEMCPWHEPGMRMGTGAEEALAAARAAWSPRF